MSQSSKHHKAEQQNRALWDEIAPIHMKAYTEVALLREGAEVLDDIELRELGPVEGKSLLHLQFVSTICRCPNLMADELSSK